MVILIGSQFRVYFHISFHLFTLVSYFSQSCLFFLIQVLEILTPIFCSAYIYFINILVTCDVGPAVILGKINQFAYNIFKGRSSGDCYNLGNDLLGSRQK